MFGLKVSLALPPAPTRESIAAWQPRTVPAMFRDHQRWRIPFIARGARGPVGGHTRVLGCMYSWNDERSFGYSFTRRLSLFGIVRFKHQQTEDGRWKLCGPAFQVSWFKIEFRIKAASHH